MEMEICAGIVLYNPEINRLRDNIRAIERQVDRVILVDNYSKNIKEIEKEFGEKKNIYIIKNNKNYGIARALNQSMIFARENKYSWLLTLDQDSVCPIDMIEEYVKYIELDKIGIICPRIIDRNKSINGVVETKNKYIEKCITSGALTNIKIFNEIGQFDEKMFIDLVDFDYCKRLRKHGYKILQINNVELLHEIGQIREYKFFFWIVCVKNHSKFRKYYMARNIIYYTKKHNSLLAIIPAYMRIIKIVILIILYEQDKINKCKAIAKGCFDGHTLKV